MRTIIRHGEERGTAPRHGERYAHVCRGLSRLGDRRADSLGRGQQIVHQMLTDHGGCGGAFSQRPGERRASLAGRRASVIRAEDLGRRDAFAELDEGDPQGRRRGQRLDQLATASYQRIRCGAREERHVRSHPRAHDLETLLVEAPYARERPQHGTRVARTTAEPCRYRDPLLHAYVRERSAAVCLGQSKHGPRGEILALGRADVRRDPNVERRAKGDTDAIAEVDRREDRDELVIAIRAATEHFEREVDLRRGHHHDRAAHASGTPAAFASAIHSSSESSSALRSGAMPARARTSVARGRSIPASWPSAERNCLRRCLKASLTKRKNGSCASGANAGTARLRRATTADSTRGAGRKARAGTRRMIRGSGKGWTKTDR